MAGRIEFEGTVRYEVVTPIAPPVAAHSQRPLWNRQRLVLAAVAFAVAGALWYRTSRQENASPVQATSAPANDVPPAGKSPESRTKTASRPPQQPPKLPAPAVTGQA